ncbi:MAG: redoxin domain-containing protein [Spirochaetales bacterium]|jgi:peroxiredoxin|nr:redoxin domain-containing protein [Spirochaetales bacterium]
MRNYQATVKTSILTILVLSIPLTLSAETDANLADRLGLKTFEAGVEAPDFELEFLNGEKRKLSEFRGDVVFLNFWATWCPPCRLEMPSMQALYDRHASSGLTILAVDLQEPETAVRKFVDDYKLTFPIPLDSEGRVGAMYGVRSIPTTYIIDRDGMVLSVAVGAREWDSDISLLYFDEILKK